MTQTTDKDVLSWGTKGGYFFLLLAGRPSYPLCFPCSHAGGPLLLLTRGVDVQLTLQDVVDDGLTQVVDNMAVAMLQGQSVGGAHDMSLASDMSLTQTTPPPHSR